MINAPEFDLLTCYRPVQHLSPAYLGRLLVLLGSTCGHPCSDHSSIL
ncbi:MAG: hypothetical protein ACK6A8_13170 [Planctomycetota bacterium]